MESNREEWIKGIIGVVLFSIITSVLTYLCGALVGIGYLGFKMVTKVGGF